MLYPIFRENTEESCTFHPGAPYFHDAYKGVSNETEKQAKRVGIHIQVISSNTDLQYGQLATTHSNIIVKLVDPCDFARSFV